MRSTIPFDSHAKHGDWIMAFHTPSYMATQLFYCIDNLGHHDCNSCYKISRSDYHNYCILITKKGQGTLVYENRKYDLTVNTVAFIDCMDMHEYYPTDSSWEFYWIHFYGAMSSRYYNYVHENIGPVINVRSSSFDYLNAMENILELKISGDIHFESKASNTLSLLLNSLIINLPNTKNLNDSEASKIAKAIDFIKENYSKDISVEEISGTVFLSHYYFIRIFKKETGFSPYEYLIKYRISQAKNLIASSDKSIQEIAKEVGFSSVNNFISTFKKYEKITPYKYRKKNCC